MARVPKTNKLGIKYAEETSFEVLPNNPTWKYTKTRGGLTAGAETTEARSETIEKERQLPKPTIVDLNSTFAIDNDLSFDWVNDFIPALLYTINPNDDIVFFSQGANSSGYSASGITSSNESGRKLPYTSSSQHTGILFARGFSVVDNNGLKFQTGNITTNTISVSGLTGESSNERQVVERAGVRTAANTVRLSVNSTARTGTLTISQANFNQWGIIPGMWLFIGGDSTTNRLSADNYGWCRVVNVISNTILNVDKCSRGLSTANSTNRVDIFFGRIYRNTSIESSLYRERSYQFELEYPDLVDPTNSNNVGGYEYSVGNYANTGSFSLPLSSVGSASVGFIGSDTLPAVFTRKTGTNRRVIGDGLFNTSKDIARLRILDVDNEGIETDFKSVTINIDNGVTAEKVLEKLGARDMNLGSLTVSLEMQALFTSKVINEAVRDGRSMSLDGILRNDDGAIVFDIPALTLSGGAKEFAVGESIRINANGTSYGDGIFDASLMVNVLPYVPNLP